MHAKKYIENILGYLEVVPIAMVTKNCLNNTLYGICYEFSNKSAALRREFQRYLPIRRFKE